MIFLWLKRSYNILNKKVWKKRKKKNPPSWFFCLKLEKRNLFWFFHKKRFGACFNCLRTPTIPDLVLCTMSSFSSAPVFVVGLAMPMIILLVVYSVMGMQFVWKMWKSSLLLLRQLCLFLVSFERCTGICVSFLWFELSLCFVSHRHHNILQVLCLWV